MLIDKNGIYITKKEASMSVVVIIVLGLLIFISGYFWGKRHVIDSFSQKTSQDSFNDQVDYLLTMQSFAAKTGTNISELTNGSNEELQSAELDALPDATEECDTQKCDTQKDVEESVGMQHVQQSISTDQESVHCDKTFTGVLAGFAKKDLADQMVQRLAKRKIQVLVKKRISKSASGKSKRTWYQVVTVPCGSKDAVEAMIASITKSEKIKKSDIKIV